jgi:hypothetical protein
VGTILNTVLGYFLYKNVNKDDVMKNPYYFYIYIWFFSPMLLIIFPFPLNLIVFFSIIFIINVGNRIKW